jgi:hypothetical protein
MTWGQACEGEDTEVLEVHWEEEDSAMAEPDNRHE